MPTVATDCRVSGNPEAPGDIVSARDACAGTAHYVARQDRFTVDQADRRARVTEVYAVEGSSDAQSVSEPARTLRQLFRRPRVRAAACSLDAAGHDLTSSHQYRMRLTIWSTDDVRGVVQAVYAVDIQMPGRTEHRCVAGRLPSPPMRGRVDPALVCLDLSDTQGYGCAPLPGDEDAPQQLWREDMGRPSEE